MGEAAVGRRRRGRLGAMDAEDRGVRPIIGAALLRALRLWRSLPRGSDQRCGGGSGDAPTPWGGTSVTPSATGIRSPAGCTSDVITRAHAGLAPESKLIFAPRPGTTFFDSSGPTSTQSAGMSS